MRYAYENGNVELKAKFVSKLKLLHRRPVESWRDPLAKQLHGVCSGLVEVRFKAGGVQQRPIGFFSGDHEFILLFWATEKGGKFVPKSACETANRWKLESINNRSVTDALWLALE